MNNYKINTIIIDDSVYETGLNKEIHKSKDLQAYRPETNRCIYSQD